jgi:hypothetical protein
MLLTPKIKNGLQHLLKIMLTDQDYYPMRFRIVVRNDSNQVSSRTLGESRGDVDPGSRKGVAAGVVRNALNVL